SSGSAKQGSPHPPLVDIGHGEMQADATARQTGLSGLFRERRDILNLTPKWSKRWGPPHSAVVLVGRDPRQRHSIGNSPSRLFQGNLPFGSIAHGVGNLGFLTPGGVLGPIFWKKQITVDDGRKA